MACNTAAQLVKLRQLEHSMHFLEQRSESGFSLHSELERKLWRSRTELASAAEGANLAGMAAARADWQKYRNDAIELRCRQSLAWGCFSGIYYRLWRL